MPKQSSNGETGTESRKCSYEAFHATVVHRSDIKNAPYNPRVMSDAARKKLRRNLKDRGLMCPLTWNRRTGNIVSGHQRLRELDALEGSKDYSLTVAEVDLDEKIEQEQNIFMNNPLAMGEWAMDKLEGLFRNDGVNALAAGFSAGDAYQLFGDAPEMTQPEQMIEIAEWARQLKEQLASIKSKPAARNDQSFYMVLVFDGHQTRKEVTDRLGLPNNKFVDGRQLVEIIDAAGVPEVEYEDETEEDE